VPFNGRMRSSRSTWLTFLALALMWGSSYLFIKIAVDDFGTFTLVALRLIVGAALLWTVLRLSGKALPRDRRLYAHLMVMAFLSVTAPFLLITWAEQTVDSSLAAILTSIVPLFAVVIAPLFIHDEPFRVNTVIGLLIGFAGVVIITGRGLGVGSSDLVADLALIASSAFYAAGAVYARRNVRGVDPMIPAVFQVSFAALYTGVIALLFEQPWNARPDAGGVFAIVWLGILGSGFAYLAFFRVLADWGATRTTSVAYLLPIVGIVLGFLVLAEPLDARVLAGTALVLAGMFLVNRKGSLFPSRRASVALADPKP
jgi:drug/metabolite transporter (DMT)-like permease